MWRLGAWWREEEKRRRFSCRRDGFKWNFDRARKPAVPRNHQHPPSSSFQHPAFLSGSDSRPTYYRICALAFQFSRLSNCRDPPSPASWCIDAFLSTHTNRARTGTEVEGGYVHVMMFAQVAQISIEFFDALFVRFGAFALQSLVELRRR